MPTTSTGMGQFTTVFDAVGSGTLTTSLAANTSSFSTHGSEFAEFCIGYTKGGEGGVYVRVELSTDNGTTWFVVPYTPAGSTSSPLTNYVALTASANKRFGIRRIARCETMMRVSAALISGSANATTSLTVSVQLGASRYPIAGNVVS